MPFFISSCITEFCVVFSFNPPNTTKLLISSCNSANYAGLWESLQQVLQQILPADWLIQQNQPVLLLLFSALLASFFVAVNTGLMPIKKTNPPYKLAELKTYGDDLAKRWVVEYYAFDEDEEKLKRRQVFISRKKYRSKEERVAYADAVIKQVNHELAKGYCIPSSSTAGMPIDVAIEKYLDYKLARVGKAADYTSPLRAMFKNYLYAHHPNLKLGELGRRHILGFLDKYQAQRSWSNSTRNQKKGFIFNFCQYYVDREVLPKNPAAFVKLERVSKEVRYTPFQSHEIGYLREKLAKSDPELLLFTHFIYYCFIRPKELRFLKISDINLSQMQIRVTRERSKNNKTQFVTIPKAFYSALMDSQLMKAGGNLYVFGNEGKPGDTHYSQNTMTGRMRRFLDKLGYSRDYSLYSFKHSGCCKLYQVTKDLKLVSRQCRHHSTQVTDLYLRDLGMYTDRDVMDEFV